MGHAAFFRLGRRPAKPVLWFVWGLGAGVKGYSFSFLFCLSAFLLKSESTFFAPGQV